ncbi:hypothetical protein MBLNU459_g8240t2 [Dothideomycetes sp. NU459]
MRFSLLTVCSLAASVLATPTTNYAVHEKRDVLPHGWAKRERLDRRAIMPMRIALKQRNIERGYELLNEVSHPDSAKYGQHWTVEKVAEMFSPSDESVKVVKEWLASAGIPMEEIKQTKSNGWLTFDATADEAEALLKTEYNVYEYVNGQPHVGCEEYSLPRQVREHVDFVTPSVHFDTKIKSRSDESSERLSKRQSPNTAKAIGQPGGWSIPKFGRWLSPNQIIQELENCDKQIVPDCLRALYLLPPGVSANPKNSYGIVEYTPQAYVPSDLDLFFSNFSKKQIGERPILDSIDGGYPQQTTKGFDYNGESDLDLEYAMTLVYPQKVTLYQVGDVVEGASFNNFLDALDASYCGGDDPTQDAVYPDPYNNYTGAYEGPEACGTFAATKVISTSYGYNEADLTPAYEERQCNEYMKLGLLGTTFLYSSGDYGVAGNGGQCLNANGTYNNGSSGRFNPSFPGTCPYILSVGATQVKNNTNVIEALATGTQPEEACETVIYSGGGFSNVFPLPSYQAAAVKNWFAKYPPPYGADRFNNSQVTRGFPDVSANGANYVIAIDGTFSLVYGTSASSPTFGSVLTLINEARYNVGKSSIGFINPTLYAHAGVLNDITEGGNQGCGTAGFSAAPGWDPVTGLGT